VRIVQHWTKSSRPRTTIEVVGPDTLTGADIAAIWASVLGREKLASPLRSPAMSAHPHRCSVSLKCEERQPE
jgi:hypothetical protein